MCCLCFFLLLLDIELLFRSLFNHSTTPFCFLVFVSLSPGSASPPTGYSEGQCLSCGDVTGPGSSGAEGSAAAAATQEKGLSPQTRHDRETDEDSVRGCSDKEGETCGPCSMMCSKNSLFLSCMGL